MSDNYRNIFQTQSNARPNAVNLCYFSPGGSLKVIITGSLIENSSWNFELLSWVFRGYNALSRFIMV